MLRLDKRRIGTELEQRLVLAVLVLAVVIVVYPQVSVLSFFECLFFLWECSINMMYFSWYLLLLKFIYEGYDICEYSDILFRFSL